MILTLEWWAPTMPDGFAWQPAVYLGGLAVALLPVILVTTVARWRHVPLSARSRRYLAGGTLLLIATLASPLAEVGQITLSGRAVQYLALALVAPPLLLLGVPRWREEGRSRSRRVVEHLLGTPWAGALLLAGVTWLTHLPAAIDGVESGTVGASAIRLAWLGAAFLYWWPLVGPGPERERLPYLAGIGYLVLPFVFPKLPAVTWVFATELLHERYLDGPGVEVWGLSPLADQGVAAFVIWLPGSIVVAVALYLLFRHWYREDQRLMVRQRLGVPADPAAIAALMAGPGGAERWRLLEALLAIVDDAAPPRLGSDLRFEVHGEQVLLQLMVPDGPPAQRELLARRIDAAYAVHLRRYAPRQATALRARLDVEIVPYGSRVT